MRAEWLKVCAGRLPTMTGGLPMRLFADAF
jgi:hypothetical protein